jgi:hypothetical protein
MPQPKQSTMVAVLVALIAASGFFTIIAVSAPESVSGKQLGNGLVARIRFSKDTYNATDWILATYEYYNPTDSPINATLPKSYPTYSGYEGQTPFLTPYKLAHLRNVTVPPHEAVDVFGLAPNVIAPGTFTVSLNGTYASVVIRSIGLVPNVVTDKQSYKVGDGGTATLEMFNAGSSPLRYSNFSPLELRSWYVGEEPGDIRHLVFVSWIDPTTSVQPGETHTVMSFSFPTPKSGTLILDFNGVVKLVAVRP